MPLREKVFKAANIVLYPAIVVLTQDLFPNNQMSAFKAVLNKLSPQAILDLLHYA